MDEIWGSLCGINDPMPGSVKGVSSPYVPLTPSASSPSPPAFLVSARQLPPQYSAFPWASPLVHVACDCLDIVLNILYHLPWEPPWCPIAIAQSWNFSAWIHGSAENNPVPASAHGFLSHLALHFSGSRQFLYPLFSSTLWFMPLSPLEWLFSISSCWDAKSLLIDSFSTVIESLLCAHCSRCWA